MSEKKRTIMLGFHSTVDGKLLREWVTGLGYDVVESLDDTAGIDLVLMDSVTARRHMDKAFGLKKAAKYFLPTLVCVNAGEDVGRWLSAGFDDVLHLPATKDEWRARIEIMLRLRRQSEELGQKSELLHKALVESSSDQIFMLDANGTYVTSNDRVEHLGLERGDELVGKTIEQVYPKEVAPFYRIQIQRVLSERKTVVFEHNLPSDQDTYHHLDTLYPVNLPNGTVMVGGICRDITERKQAEKALKESELKFQKIITESFAGISVVNEEGKIIVWNNALEEILGIKSTETIGRYIWDVELALIERETNGTKRMQELKSKILGTLKTGEAPWLNKVMEREYIHPDGNVKLVSGRMYTIKTQKGYVVVSVSNDITESKRVERALKEAQSNLQALLDNRKDSIWSLDRNYNYLVFNKPYADVIYNEMGIRIEKGMNAFDIHPKEVNDFWKPKFDEVFKGKHVTFEFSHVLDGKEHFFEVLMNPIYTDNKVSGLSALSIDITDRKEAEIELAKSEQRYRSVFENTGTAMIIVNEDGAIAFANKQCTPTTGYSPEELQSTDWRHYVFADDLPMMENNFRLRISDPEKAPKRYETRLVHANGSTRNCMLTIDTIPMTGQIVVSMLDITESKQAEKQLMESEARYRSLIEESNDGIYLLYDRKFEIVNNKFVEMFGYTKKEMHHPDFDFIQLIAPKSRKFINERYKQISLGEDIPNKYEFTAISKNGKEFEVEASVTYINYNDGIATQGIIRDITDRKKQQDILMNTIFNVQESERNNFGRELHDGLSQILYSTSLYLESLRKIKDELPESKKKELEKAYQLNNQAINDTRRISHGLMVAGIKEGGIKYLIKKICSDSSTPFLTFSYTFSNIDEKKIGDETKVHLYRIIQELVTNILKHSKATQAKIRLSMLNAETLNMIVSDNGKGFKHGEIKPGAGLQTASQRVTILKGKIEISSSKGKGTITKVIIPLNP